jgi:hypothetical protein
MIGTTQAREPAARPVLAIGLGVEGCRPATGHGRISTRLQNDQFIAKATIL